MKGNIRVLNVLDCIKIKDLKKHKLTFSYLKFEASRLALVHGYIFFSGGIFLQIAHNKWVW
jgi:hypothetical protein